MWNRSWRLLTWRGLLGLKHAITSGVESSDKNDYRLGGDAVNSFEFILQEGILIMALVVISMVAIGAFLVVRKEWNQRNDKL
jgi:hypothetical protein